MDLKGIGPYLFGSIIGEGTFSIVRLCYFDEKLLQKIEDQNNQKTENKQNDNNEIDTSNTTEQDMPDRKYYAAKIISRNKLKTSKVVEERFETEIRVMQQLHHPGVVQIIDLFKDSNYYFVILEFCPHGNLYHFVVRHENGRLSEDEAKPIFKQILETIQYLHSIRISHRDMKLENILLDSTGRIKISDFGLSRLLAPLKDSEIQQQNKKKAEQKNKKISIMPSAPLLTDFSIPPPADNPLKDMPPPLSISANNSLQTIPNFVPINSISSQPQRRASFDTGPSFVNNFPNISPLVSPRADQPSNPPILSSIKSNSNSNGLLSNDKPIEQQNFNIPPPLVSSLNSPIKIPPPQLNSNTPTSPVIGIPPPIMQSPLKLQPISSSPLRQIPMPLVSSNIINPIPPPLSQATNLSSSLIPPLNINNSTISSSNPNINLNMINNKFNADSIITSNTSSSSNLFHQNLSEDCKPNLNSDNNTDNSKTTNAVSNSSVTLMTNSNSISSIAPDQIASGKNNTNTKQSRRRGSYLPKSSLIPLDISSSSLISTSNSNSNESNLPDNDVFPEDLVSTPCGSPCYASPECLSGKPYSGLTTDIWSCGVILFEMLTGQLPWTKRNEAQMFEQIKRGEYSVPNFLSSGAKNLIRSLLTVNVKKRYNAEQALDDDWISQIPIQFPPCLRSISPLSGVFIKYLIEKGKEKEKEEADEANLIRIDSLYSESNQISIEKHKTRLKRANSHSVQNRKLFISNDSISDLTSLNNPIVDLTEKEKSEYQKDMIIIKRQLQDALKSSNVSSRRRRRNTDFPGSKPKDLDIFSKNSKYNIQNLFNLVDKNVVSLKKVDEFFRGSIEKFDIFEEEFDNELKFDIDEAIENHSRLDKISETDRPIIYYSMNNILNDFSITNNLLQPNQSTLDTRKDPHEPNHQENNNIEGYNPPILITRPKDIIIV